MVQIPVKGQEKMRLNEMSQLKLFPSGPQQIGCCPFTLGMEI